MQLAGNRDWDSSSLKSIRPFTQKARFTCQFLPNCATTQSPYIQVAFRLDGAGRHLPPPAPREQAASRFFLLGRISCGKKRVAALSSSADTPAGTTAWPGRVSLDRWPTCAWWATTPRFLRLCFLRCRTRSGLAGYCQNTSTRPVLLPLFSRRLAQLLARRAENAEYCLIADTSGRLTTGYANSVGGRSRSLVGPPRKRTR
jgi:hypothetical protein